jgi:hypothetical protein
MSNLDGFTKRIARLVDRSLDEMEHQAEPLTVQQVTSLEKINKIVEVLIDREKERGEQTTYREQSTEELIRLLEENNSDEESND